MGRMRPQPDSPLPPHFSLSLQPLRLPQLASLHLEVIRLFVKSCGFRLEGGRVEDAAHHVLGLGFAFEGVGLFRRRRGEGVWGSSDAGKWGWTRMGLGEFQCVFQDTVKGCLEEVEQEAGPGAVVW